MAAGAPDYERIVTIVAEVAMGRGAPDWERIVVGAGGVPIGGGGLVYETVSAANDQTVAPGDSAAMCSLSFPDSGFWLVLGQVAPFTPGVNGTYGFSAFLETNSQAGIVLGGGSTYDQRDISAEDATFYAYPMFGALLQVFTGGAGNVTMNVTAIGTNPANLIFVGPASPAAPQCYLIALKIG